MFHITRTDLAKKSDAQLKGLFYQAQKKANRAPPSSPAFTAAQCALSLIRQEIAHRASHAP